VASTTSLKWNWSWKGIYGIISSHVHRNIMDYFSLNLTSYYGIMETHFPSKWNGMHKGIQQVSLPIFWYVRQSSTPIRREWYRLSVMIPDTTILTTFDVCYFIVQLKWFCWRVSGVSKIFLWLGKYYYAYQYLCNNDIKKIVRIISTEPK